MFVQLKVCTEFCILNVLKIHILLLIVNERVELEKGL